LDSTIGPCAYYVPGTNPLNCQNKQHRINYHKDESCSFKYCEWRKREIEKFWTDFFQTTRKEIIAELTTDMTTSMSGLNLQVKRTDSQQSDSTMALTCQNQQVGSSSQEYHSERQTGGESATDPLSEKSMSESAALYEMSVDEYRKVITYEFTGFDTLDQMAAIYTTKHCQSAEGSIVLHREQGGMATEYGLTAERGVVLHR